MLSPVKGIKRSIWNPEIINTATENIGTHDIKFFYKIEPRTDLPSIFCTRRSSQLEQLSRSKRTFREARALFFNLQPPGYPRELSNLWLVVLHLLLESLAGRKRIRASSCCGTAAEPTTGRENEVREGKDKLNIKGHVDGCILRTHAYLGRRIGKHFAAAANKNLISWIPWPTQRKMEYEIVPAAGRHGNERLLCIARATGRWRGA